MSDQQEQQQPAWGSAGIQPLMQILMFIMFTPAYSILVFQRARVGFRQLTYVRIFGLTGAMLGIAWLFSHAFPTHSMRLSAWPLMLYALAFLGTALWQHHARWTDLMSGVRWHTKSTGVTHTMPLFESHLKEHHVYRFADPAVSLLVGAVVTLFSVSLGLWLMFAAANLFALEHFLWERDLEKLLNMLDNLIDAEVRSENLKAFSGGAPSFDTASREATGGVLSTGAIMPDLIEKRRQRAAREGRPISVDVVAQAGEGAVS